MVPLKVMLIEVWHAVAHWIEPFIPGALGAAVAQLWEPGLSLRQRLEQWTAGLLFAVYVVPAIGHVFSWGQPVINGVGFVVGTLALRTYPVLREAFVVGMSGSLKSIPEVFRSWARKPGAEPEAPKDGEP